MCGITGYWTRDCPSEAWLRDLTAAVATLRLRGPDDSGTWRRTGGDVAFGHTRLSILDLSELGRQPMASADGDLVMVFNGEIYNFAEIRSELEAGGHRFRSSGDSEVVLAALRQWGIAAVDRFIGMFAIALWHERTRRLWLIRDRMGVKPLYYAWDGRVLWFGSELKALRAFRAWPAELDQQALGEYFQFGYISAPRSVYRRVHKLLPGHWLELGATGDPVTRCYWSALGPREVLAGSESDLEAELEALLVDAFRYRMVADVPVGVFLSGGVDSSLVTGILQRHSARQVHTYTVGFSENGFDESRNARAVAAHLGTRHTERILGPAEMIRILPRWADLFDEPFGDSSGIPTFLVSQVAREGVKVALSADGGDELFSGYHHYDVMLDRQRALQRVPQLARNAFSRVLQALPASMMENAVAALPAPAVLRHAARREVVERVEKLRAVLPAADQGTLYDIGVSHWMPAEVSRLLGGAVPARPVLNGHPRSFADHMSCCDLRHYLPDDILTKVDRATMAVGLEGREPLLDHRIVEFALRLPPGLRRGTLGTKHLLRRILYRYVPRPLVDRPKQGFAIPIARWLRAELAPLIDRYLAPERVREAGILDPAVVGRTVRNFRDAGARRDRVDVQKLWLLVAFEMWRERWGAVEPERKAA
jgi:asparagine synthase (glutamine-hydrolysing)